MHPVQIFVFHYFIACFAFDPSFVAILDPDGSATHKSITRCSLAKVTSEYFYTRFKINITASSITRGICPSTFFSRIRNAFSSSAYTGGSSYSRWENMIDEIVDHNERVDVLEQFTDSRHFDSESFIDGSAIIRTRLKSAVDALADKDFETSNEHFRSTHTYCTR